MIPKRLFYVWVGEPKTNIVNICIMNWKEKLPDFEIIEVNESSEYFNFTEEYENCKWFRDIYDRKMWALVSDYMRCKVLLDYGGVYIDTDVTILKDITPFLENEFFAGYEEENYISAGIIGSVKAHPYIEKVLDFYHDEIYKSSLYTIPSILNEIYRRNTFTNVTIYPVEYFYPFKYRTIFTPDCIKENSYAIHWWAASWHNPEELEFLKNKHKTYNLHKHIQFSID